MSHSYGPKLGGPDGGRIAGGGIMGRPGGGIGGPAPNIGGRG